MRRFSWLEWAGWQSGARPDGIVGVLDHVGKRLQGRPIQLLLKLGGRGIQCSGVSTSMTTSALAAMAWVCLRMAAGTPFSGSASGPTGPSTISPTTSQMGRSVGVDCKGT